MSRSASNAVFRAGGARSWKGAQLSGAETSGNLEEKIQFKFKKALRETQNLRAGCSKAAQLLDVAKRPIPQG